MKQADGPESVDCWMWKMHFNAQRVQNRIFSNEAKFTMEIDQRPIKTRSLADIERQAAKLGAMMKVIRSSMLKPNSAKTPPLIGVREIADLAQVDKPKAEYAIGKRELPEPVLIANKRSWSLGDVAPVIRELRAKNMRPEGAIGVTIAVANFKGGVSKTTTAVTLAQGLALRGHRVLMIDMDPQGSATTLFGVLPDVDVEPEQTALPLFDGSQEDITYAIRPTYFPGIDLVPATTLLFNAEFLLPARQMQAQAAGEEFRFWSTLDQGLDAARLAYDVIVIDTAPALSYGTTNAMIAADGILMPLPPSALDFSSSAQFWDLFSDLCSGIGGRSTVEKSFEFIDVLLSRVDSDAASSVVRGWVLEAYGDMVLPIEIPKTSVAATASAEFGTVYDIERGSIKAQTLARARTAYDRMCELIEQQINACWTKQLAQLTETKKGL